MVATTGIPVPQARGMAVYNTRTVNMRADQARALAVYKSDTSMAVTQAQVMAVCHGRVAEPSVRAFTFTLDGHDFYVLRLGDATTLLYDLSSQEWVEWTSDTLAFWRANCGINWIGAQKVGYNFGGTDVILGDDTWGLLWFLAPTQGFDDHPDVNSVVQQVSFPRIAMAQTTVPNRQNIPCYAIYVDTDNYGLTAKDFVPQVNLETSDDQGQSWLSHGIYTAVQAQDGVGGSGGYNWYSLGQMSSPGRLFRITDNGLLNRIDSLEMNDE